MSRKWFHRVGTPMPRHAMSARRMIAFLQTVLDRADGEDVMLDFPEGFWVSYTDENEESVQP